MEMQDTIKDLRRELLASREAQQRHLEAEQETTEGPILPDSTVLFTRLDSERNAKAMKKAMVEKKLDPDVYNVGIFVLSFRFKFALFCSIMKFS